MALTKALARPGRKLAWRAAGVGAVTLAAAFGWLTLTAQQASAYIGVSFLSAPGLVRTSGGSGPYKTWLQISGHYWMQTDDGGIFGGNRNRLRRTRMYFSGPPAPQGGAGRIAISIDKRSRALPLLMARCAAKAELPELSFAEASMRARGLAENGPRPAAFPEFYEYRLSRVKFADCPVVAGAPEQAIVLSFQDIDWVNYSGPPEGQDNPFTPASFMPVSQTGQTRSFVLSWFAVANDAAEGQCPKVNAKPTEADYYALVPPEAAAKERLERAKEGGVNYENGQMARRGPDKLNACLLPGILPDPGHIYPVSDLARGLDLDGDNGSGKAPAGVCRHRNYRSDDGRSGIDNQLFTVQGCMPGYQGHKGFLMQYRNEQRRNGLLSMLVQITGIDDDRNDDQVEVGILYSKDPMAKNSAGSVILPDFTFRPTNENEYRHYFTRLRGRIVNGVIETERAPQLQFHPGLDAEVTLFQAGLRLRILPDGSLKGIAAGYEDWRRVMQMNANSNSESLYGFQCPALYGALKRAADGLKNPETGECDGISSAYDLEGVAAFAPVVQQVARN